MAVAEQAPPLVQTETVYVDNPLWQQISGGLAGLWLATVMAWWWSKRTVEKPAKEVEPTPPYKLQARQLKIARKAALAGDAVTLKSAMIEWGRIQWPDSAPRNVGDLASCVSMPLSIELQKLCSASYGPGTDDWNGQAVAKALRSFAVLEDDAARSDGEELPPLFPNAA